MPWRRRYDHESLCTRYPPVGGAPFGEVVADPRCARGTVEGASHAQEYDRTDVHPSVRAEREAGHVDRFQRAVFEVPFGVDADLEVRFDPLDHACGGHSEVAFRMSHEQHVVHVEDDVVDEASAHGGPVLAAARGGQLFGGVVEGAGKVVVRQPLAQIRSDVQSVLALVRVDEREREPEQLGVSDVAGEHLLERRTVDARIVFADVHLDEVFEPAFERPSFDELADAACSPAFDAGALVRADLGLEHGHEGRDRDPVEDLVAYRLPADDPSFPVRRLDAVEVSDFSESDVPAADLSSHVGGDRVEVAIV